MLISEARFTDDASSKIKGTLEKDLPLIIFGCIDESGSSDENTEKTESSQMMTMKKQKVMTMRIH